MRPPASSLLLFLFLSAGALPGAAASEWLGKPDCRIAALKPAPLDDRVSWSGACRDGYAEGKGTLEWKAGDKDERRLDGVLVRGEVSGEGTLRYRAGKYIGGFRHGLPHGPGYFEYKSGDRYEGEVADGVRHGRGVYEALDGSSYQGDWKDGQRHGKGKAIFTLGGSYEGEWRDGVFDGQGRIVYAGSGRSWQGLFRAGRPADTAAQQAAQDTPERFALNPSQSELGSNIKRASVTSNIPPDSAWEQLTSAQQGILRSVYPALAEGDEPPYPLKGDGPIARATSELFRRFLDEEGEALVYVLVGADGTPKTASTYGMPNAEFGRHLSMVAMLQRYKPARCDGAPCEMIYPINFRFRLRLL